MSIAAGRPLLQGAAIANALGIRAEAPPRGRRFCHGASQATPFAQGHWQSSSTTTTVAHALSMERSGQFLRQPPEEHVRWMSRSRRMRLRAEAERQAESAAGAPGSGAASGIAGSPPPLAAHQSRDGSPGAGSSDAGGAPPGAAAASVGDSTAEAQVAQLRAELQEMRQLVTAQAALTSQQQLTISSLQRSLQGMSPGQSGSGAQSAFHTPETPKLY